MSRSPSRQTTAAAWKKCWSAIASRRSSPYTDDPCARRQRTRSDLALAGRARRAVQRRIVEAFKEFIQGLGRGPTDEDLSTFARLAVAEQRLRRRNSPRKSPGQKSGLRF